MRRNVGPMSINMDYFPSQAFPKSASVVPSCKEGDGWEYDAAVTYFTGKRIADVTYEDIRSNYGNTDWTASLSFLSDQAFSFFLPALLKIAQENYCDLSGNAGVLGDNLVFSFRRMAEGTMDHRLLPLLRAYSKQQLGVISLFLQEMSEQHYQGMGDMDDAAVALNLFWSQYLPNM